MQDIYNLIAGNALSWVLTITVPVSALYVISWLRVLTQQARFAQKNRIDEVIFNILWTEARTFTAFIAKAKSKVAADNLKKQASIQAITNLKVRMGSSYGIDLTKSHSDKALHTILHTAVHAAKK